MKTNSSSASGNKKKNVDSNKSGVPVQPKIRQIVHEKPSEKKLLTAAMQLIKIFNNPEQRIKATASSQLKEPSRMQSNTRTNERTIRSPVPQFVVKKITEVSRDDQSKITSDAKTPAIITRTSDLSKENRRRRDVKKLQEMVQIQRQKSLRIFNKSTNDGKVMPCTQANCDNESANKQKPIYSSKILCTARNQNSPQKQLDQKPTEPFLKSIVENRKDGSKPHQIIKTIAQNPHLVSTKNSSVSKDRQDTTDTDKTLSNRKQITACMDKKAIGTSPQKVPLKNHIVPFRDIAHVDQPGWHKRRLSLQCDSNQTIDAIYKLPKQLSRCNSCFAGSDAPINFFDQAVKVSEEYADLYRSYLPDNRIEAVPKRRGRRKKTAPNKTKKLLDSKDFLVSADLAEIHDKHTKPTSDERAPIEGKQTPAVVTPLRRSKRFRKSSTKTDVQDNDTVLTSSHVTEPTKKPQTFFRVDDLSTNTKRMISEDEHLAITNIHLPFPSHDLKLSSVECSPVNSAATSFDDVRPLENENLRYSFEYMDENDELESPAYEPHPHVVRSSVNRLDDFSTVRTVVNTLHQKLPEVGRSRIRTCQKPLIELTDAPSMANESIRASPQQSVLISLQLQNLVTILPMNGSFRKRKHQHEPLETVKKQVIIEKGTLRK